MQLQKPKDQEQTEKKINQNQVAIQESQQQNPRYRSPYFFDYLKLLLGFVSSETQYPINSIEIHSIIHDKHIICNFKQTFHQEVTLIDVFFKHNDEYLKLKYAYGHYEFTLYVLLLPFQSQNHYLHPKQQGNFGTVYKITSFGKKIAVKCFHFQKQSFLKTFQQVLKEYLILYLGSQFQFGPKTSYQTFNVIVYPSCIQFQMELCRHLGQKQIDYDKLEEDLKQAMQKMHSHRIVHFDIKPSNICFSKERNKYIYIDFGLSQMIKQHAGQQIITNYRGSLDYCSDEMKRALFNGEKVVLDPYYNDCVCLDNLLKEIKKRSVENVQSQSEEPQHAVSELNISIKLKYLLWIAYFDLSQQNYNMYFQEIQNLFKCLTYNKYIEQIVLLVSEMQYNFVAKNTIRSLLVGKNCFEELNKNVFQMVSLNLRQDQFKRVFQDKIEIKKKAISNLTYKQSDPIQVIKQNKNHPFNRKYWIQYYKNISSLKNGQQFFYKAAQIISIKYFKFSYVQKQQISQNILKHTNMTRKQQYFSCLHQVTLQVFNYALNGKFNKKKGNIIANLFISITFMELLTQSQLQQIFVRITIILKQNELDFQILIQILNAIELIRYKVFTKYDYYRLLFYFLQQIQTLIEGKVLQDSCQSVYIKVTKLIIQFYFKQSSYRVLNKSMNLLNSLHNNKCAEQFQLAERQRNYQLFRKFRSYISSLVNYVSFARRNIFLRNVPSRNLFYLQYVERQRELFNEYSSFNIIHFTIEDIISTLKQQKTFQLHQLFLKSFFCFPQIYQFSIMYNLLKGKLLATYINNFQHFPKLIVGEINRFNKCQSIDIIKYFYIGEYLDFYQQQQHKTNKNFEFNKRDQLKRRYFDFGKHLRVTFDRLYYYKIKTHKHKQIQAQIQQLKKMKRNYFQYFQSNKQQVEEIIKEDTYFYKNNLHLITCFQCKYYVLQSINMQLIKLYLKEKNWLLIFQFYLTKCIAVKKYKYSGEIIYYIIRLLQTAEMSQTIHQRYNLGQIIINILPLPQKILTSNSRVIQLYNCFSIACFYILKESFSFFSQFVFKIMEEMQNYGLADQIYKMNQFKAQMAILFSSPQQISKQQVLKITQAVFMGWLPYSSERVQLIRENVLKIYRFIQTQKNPYTIFICLPFVSPQNHYFTDRFKGELFKKIALLFNSASLKIKSLSVQDYYSMFISSKQIKNKRKLRFIFRKCLPYQQVIKSAKNYINIDFVNQIFRHIKNSQIKKQDFEKWKLIKNCRKSMRKNLRLSQLYTIVNQNTMS